MHVAVQEEEKLGKYQDFAGVILRLLGISTKVIPFVKGVLDTVFNILNIYFIVVGVNTRNMLIQKSAVLQRL